MPSLATRCLRTGVGLGTEIAMQGLIRRYPKDDRYIVSAARSRAQREREAHMAKTITKALTKTQLGHYKQMLENKAAELRQNMLMPAAANIVARREEPVDVADLSTQSHEEWIFLNRNSLDMSLLRQIQDALMRIQEQTYGICQECGTPISIKRLEAVPWASYCLHCQDQHRSWTPGD